MTFKSTRNAPEPGTEGSSGSPEATPPVVPEAAPPVVPEAAPEATPEAASEVPEATPESPEASKGFTLADIVAAVKALSPQPEAAPEVTPEVPEVAPDPTGALLRSMLIQQAKVPDELTALLPKDLTKLSEFLGSESYKVLSSGMRVASQKQPPNTGAPSPTPGAGEKPKETISPKTFSDVTLELLTEFDNFS